MAFLVTFIVINIFAHVSGLFEQCNHLVQLKPGQKIFINSPYYPAEYLQGTSCRYEVQAPADYQLNFKCDIKLNTLASDTRCQHESFHYNPEGDELLTASEYFCGNGRFERKSFLNRAVISYISTPFYKRTLLGNTKEKLTVDVEELKNGQQHSSKVKVSLASTTTTTTSTPATTTTPQPVIVLANTMPEVLESSDDNFSDEMLQVLTDAGMSNALAYVASLLCNTNGNSAENCVFEDDDDDDDENASYNAKAISTTTTMKTISNLDKLPTKITWQQQQQQQQQRRRNTTKQSTKRRTTTKISKTSVKRAKIVTTDVTLDGGGGAAGGRFSCLVSTIEPTCECGWSMSLKIATPGAATGAAAAEAGINEFPSMAGVLTKKYGQIFCGAAIIHQRYLLSAAHCYNTPTTNHSALIRVIVGEHDLSTVLESLYTRTYDIADIILHEHFSHGHTNMRNDIAILRTRERITWNRSVGPACLPFRTLYASSLVSSAKRPPFTGQRVDVAGWGTTSFGGAQSKRLLKTTLDVIDVQRCRQMLAAATPAHTFCTFTPGHDTCQYDSGGALYERSGGYLMAVGIVSYGYACATQQPSVNTRIASYVKWIKEKTPDARYCVK